MIRPAYLVDTDIVIQHLRRVRAVTTRLEKLLPYGFGLSLISLGELWEGVMFSRSPAGDQAELEEFLSLVSLIGIDEAISRRFGQLRGQLRKQKRKVADFDLLIAATALEHNLTLLSNNRRHFEDIEGLRLDSIS